MEGTGTLSTQIAGPSHIIKRPRLTKILDETEARIILLCAPAGYGKTTLAREWVATRSEPVYWYSGGPAMADVAALAVDLAELFATAESELAQRVRFQVSRGQDPRMVASALATAAPSPNALLVIDDYHYAAESLAVGTLLDELRRRTEFRWLITTRTAPSWLEPRELIYGRAVELNASVLAFSDDEARTLLPEQTDVVQKAQGWPAVIRLAALTRRSERPLTLDGPELYEFFATELFGRSQPKLQEALYLLALGGDSTPAVTSAIFGENADELTDEAARSGFTAHAGGIGAELHPLLRAFLLKRVQDLEPAKRSSLVERVISELRRCGRWDECLETLASFPDAELITTCMAGALPSLLEIGRVTTVERWIKLAESAGRSDAAPVWLARAELALREGRGQAAKQLAERAATVASSPALAASAHLVAARGAHITEDAAGVLLNTTRAEQLSDDIEIQTLAVWLALIQAYERQDVRAADLLERLKELSRHGPEDQVRITCMSAYQLVELEGPLAGLAEIEGCSELAERLRDPMLATNYVYTSAYMNALAGRYDRALDLGASLRDLAEKYRIDFATDYAMLISARAAAGMRRLREGHTYIASLKNRNESAHIDGNAVIVSCRLAIAAGDLERAQRLLAYEQRSTASPALRGEHYAHRGLLHTALNQPEAARHAFAEACTISGYCDAQVLSRLGLAALALREREDPSVAIEAISAELDRGYSDFVVVTCRACPDFARAAAEDDALVIQLASLFAQSRDLDLARSAGLRIPREHQRRGGLSRREREVLDLVLQGRTNREIAKTLFISESTAKVHVRHIFEKLGVHTRAEAAALARDILDASGS